MLTERAVRLLRTHHPSEVVLLTFTRRAANEMRERLKAAMPEKRERFWRELQITTFHSWALRTLRRWSDKIGLVRNFTVRDEADKDDVVLYAGRQLNVVPAPDAKKKAGQVSTAKAAWERENVRHTYWALMREAQAADYDMLEMLLHGLFKKPAVVESIRAGLRHVLVDEYQDTSKLQQAVLDLLAPANAFVVGDPGQAVYGFRGAHPAGFHELGERPEWVTVYLDTNYRSCPPIVAAATRLAAAMTPKGLEQVAGRDWPGKQDDAEVLDVLAGQDRDALNRLIVGDILAQGQTTWAFDAAALEAMSAGTDGAIIEGASTPGTPWKDMAILSPNWDLLTALEPVLTAAGIPCRLARKKNDLWDEPEVRWVVNVLRAVVNPEDHLALWSALNAFSPRVTLREWAKMRETASAAGVPVFQVLGRAVPAKCEYVWQAMLRFHRDSLVEGEPLQAYANRNMLDEGLAILQDELRTEFHLNSRVDGLIAMSDAFEAWAHEWRQTHNDPATVVDFLDWYSERNVHDTADEEEAPDAVTLGSVHAFKGLERKAVWVIGAEEGRWPRADVGPSLEESRRLFYVAITRGQDRVRVCTSLHKPPSRFIKEAVPGWVPAPTLFAGLIGGGGSEIARLVDVPGRSAPEQRALAGAIFDGLLEAPVYARQGGEPYDPSSKTHLLTESTWANPLPTTPVTLESIQAVVDGFRTNGIDIVGPGGDRYPFVMTEVQRRVLEEMRTPTLLNAYDAMRRNELLSSGRRHREGLIAEPEPLFFMGVDHGAGPDFEAATLVEKRGATPTAAVRARR